MLLNPPPAEQIVENYNYDRTVFEAWVDAKRHDTLDRAYNDTLERLRSLVASGGTALFDVGAGAGEFLTLARQHGFEPHGNEFAPGAIELARERADVELHLGDLDTIAGENLYDAVTMWCVLAHVSDQDELLSGALRILKPGGVLFLQTPRWSAMDTAALAAARASGGRLTRVLDRRVSDYHLTLHSAEGLRRQATRLGYEVVEVTPRSRYSMQTATYLRSLGVPGQPSDALARVMDPVVDHDLFFRNVLDLYARKPLPPTSEPSAG